jgi:NAD(P)-dependent dehydrogenase (short-subunit alcohol dehydrogenase family)
MTTSTAIVTGSSSGLGNAFASEIPQRRGRVAGVSRSTQGPDWPGVHESAVRHGSGSVAKLPRRQR